MKKLFVCFFLIFSCNVFAVTNQELIDRLDDIELEKQIRQSQNLSNELRQRLERQKQQNSQSSSTGNSKYKFIVESTVGTDYFIDLTSINKTNRGTISYIETTYSSKPKTITSGVYFHSDLTREINCLENIIYTTSATYYTFDYKIVLNIPHISAQPISISDKSTNLEFKKFICR
jgi:hypothetical protein